MVSSGSKSCGLYTLTPVGDGSGLRHEGEQGALPPLYSSGDNPLESLMKSRLYVLARIRPTDYRPDLVHHGKISVLVRAELGCSKSERHLTRINK